MVTMCSAVLSGWVTQTLPHFCFHKEMSSILFFRVEAGSKERMAYSSLNSGTGWSCSSTGNGGEEATLWKNLEVDLDKSVCIRTPDHLLTYSTTLKMTRQGFQRLSYPCGHRKVSGWFIYDLQRSWCVRPFLLVARPAESGLSSTVAS